jgi:hypothetical protein
MATKKQNPAVAKRISDRKSFVSDKVASKGITTIQARQRFYVQSRMAELKAAGKPVNAETRKKLQQKFQSGNVSRQGFAAPKKKTSTTSTTKKVVPVKSSVKTPNSSYMKNAKNWTNPLGSKVTKGNKPSNSVYSRIGRQKAY